MTGNSGVKRMQAGCDPCGIHHARQDEHAKGHPSGSLPAFIRILRRYCLPGRAGGAVDGH